MPKLAAALFGLLLLVGAADARIPRSHAAIDAFKRAHPCPANGHRAGVCPQFVIDHLRPLCAGGADAPENMAWATPASAKKKDREERALCRAIRKGTIPRASSDSALCDIVTRERWTHLAKAICVGKSSLSVN